MGDVQGDTSRCAKPPVDFKTKVPLWLGQNRTFVLKSTGGFAQRDVSPCRKDKKMKGERVEWHERVCLCMQAAPTDTICLSGISGVPIAPLHVASAGAGSPTTVEKSWKILAESWDSHLLFLGALRGRLRIRRAPSSNI